MKFAVIIASTAALIAATSQATPLVWSNCAEISFIPDASFTMDGEWSCLGEKVCGTLTGNMQFPIIEGAALKVTTRYLGRHTAIKEVDFCSTLAESGYNCPIPAGPKTFHACIDWKGEVPNIPVAVTVGAINGDGGTIFCQASSAVMNKNCTLTPNP
ncbi:hypothetical protein BGZ96_007110 [Linnemannia gamsii]|uniref:Phosphatidylglycerol/phosphatidylinositol transfer protein n=1 Tax=Linnemannia gamsii TaxID=64522 RepID=A0ABQ7K0Z3_9FUNG|nr:hypothetical protein BGZ96_007110 [Linnemannia gamsii]